MLRGEFNITEKRVLQACLDDYRTGHEIEELVDVPYSSAMRVADSLTRSEFMVKRNRNGKTVEFKTMPDVADEFGTISGVLKIKGMTIDQLIQNVTEPKSVLTNLGYEIAGLLIQQGWINLVKSENSGELHGGADSQETRWYLRLLIKRLSTITFILDELYRSGRLWKSDGSALELFERFDLNKYSSNVNMTWRDLAQIFSLRAAQVQWTETGGTLDYSNPEVPNYTNPPEG